MTIDIDLDAPGKQTGAIHIPSSRDESAWGAVMVPVTVIANGDGPTVLLVAGNHGDEYEGQVALHKLANRLAPEHVNGRVIILTGLNFPAVQAAMRTSPLDGGNMNRIFPGDPQGNISQRIAHIVAEELVSRADIVLDLHSGGKTLDFVPSAVMHHLDDDALMDKTAKALLAFGAPVAMILGEDTSGMLDGEVEGRGKVFVSTELGGLGMTTAERVRWADMGVDNVLKHFGVIDGDPAKPDHAPRFLDTEPEGCFIRARHDGLYEPLVDLGEEVEKGQPIVHVWDINNPGEEPVVYSAKRSGMFYARHGKGLVKRGDCLAVIGVDAKGIAV